MIEVFFEGTERFFGAVAQGKYYKSWIPSINGGRVEEKHEARRSSSSSCGMCIMEPQSILMAKAYPNSKFIGFDNHLASIKRANRTASFSISSMSLGSQPSIVMT